MKTFLRIFILLFIAMLLSLHAPHAHAQEPEPPAPPEETPCATALPAPAPLRADAAGATSKSSLQPAHTLATGRGVTVAVIDTGVAPHPRLQARLQPGDDLISDNPLHDCDGHGTIIAGIIAAGPGHDDYLGIAPEATILSIRQTSAHHEGGGTLETLTTAIHRALDHGAQVINISVVSCIPGTFRGTPEAAALRHDLDEALQRAEHQGTVVVAASGNLNNTCQADSIVYPAHSPTVLAVGAQEEPHTIAEYSLPPDGMALSAPGTAPVGLSPFETDNWGFASGIHTANEDSPFVGTSFAAPVVSGTAALLRERFPAETPAQLRARIIDSAEPGTGAVDPYRALTHTPARYSGAEHRSVIVTQSTDTSGAARRAYILIAAVGGIVLSWLAYQRARGSAPGC